MKFFGLFYGKRCVEVIIIDTKLRKACGLPSVPEVYEFRFPVGNKKKWHISEVEILEKK